MTLVSLFLGSEFVLGGAYYAIDLTPPGFIFFSTGSSGGGQQVATGSPSDHGFARALLWSGSAESVVDLTPPGFPGSIEATDGAHQVGGDMHALLWSGTAESVIDLNPAGYGSSVAVGVKGTQQVGSAMKVIGDYAYGHAMLWNGTADSAVDLAPGGVESDRWSGAVATTGSYQVGYGHIGTSAEHALMWFGTADSVVDLHPAGYPQDATSEAFGAWGDQQVGGVGEGDLPHAFLWRGSAASAVDLNGDLLGSMAKATNGTNQAGYATSSGMSGIAHAAVWSGTADSFVDLHQFLPAACTDSWASGIDANGDIFGLARVSDNARVFLWKPAIAGDANLDQSVSFADYLVLESNFGKTGIGWQAADFDGDGAVTFADYLLLEGNFGKTVPEPCSLGFMIVLALVARRRKRLT